MTIMRATCALAFIATLLFSEVAHVARWPDFVQKSLSFSGDTAVSIATELGIDPSRTTRFDVLSKTKPGSYQGNDEMDPLTIEFDAKAKTLRFEGNWFVSGTGTHSIDGFSHFIEVDRDSGDGRKLIESVYQKHRAILGEAPAFQIKYDDCVADRERRHSLPTSDPNYIPPFKPSLREGGARDGITDSNACARFLEKGVTGSLGENKFLLRVTYPGWAKDNSKSQSKLVLNLTFAVKNFDEVEPVQKPAKPKWKFW